MCQTEKIDRRAVNFQTKVEGYEMALLEIAQLGNSTQGRMMYARPVAIAERALERYRLPVDLNVLGIDLAEGEVVEQ